MSVEPPRSGSVPGGVGCSSVSKMRQLAFDLGPCGKEQCSCHAHNGFLTKAGYFTAAKRSLEGLGVDEAVGVGYLDNIGSVSALEAEARALAGNEMMDEWDLTESLNCVMLDHG